jgi:hypothetical protein
VRFTKILFLNFLSSKKVLRRYFFPTRALERRVEICGSSSSILILKMCHILDPGREVGTGHLGRSYAICATVGDLYRDTNAPASRIGACMVCGKLRNYTNLAAPGIRCLHKSIKQCSLTYWSGPAQAHAATSHTHASPTCPLYCEYVCTHYHDDHVRSPYVTRSPLPAAPRPLHPAAPPATAGCTAHAAAAPAATTSTAQVLP